MSTTIETQLQEANEYLTRLKSALNAIQPGVTNFSAWGLSANFDRDALLREIRATEHQIEFLEMKNESRIVEMGWWNG